MKVREFFLTICCISVLLTGCAITTSPAAHNAEAKTFLEQALPDMFKRWDSDDMDKYEGQLLRNALEEKDWKGTFKSFSDEFGTFKSIESFSPDNKFKSIVKTGGEYYSEAYTLHLLFSKEEAIFKTTLDYRDGKWLMQYFDLQPARAVPGAYKVPLKKSAKKNRQD